MADLEAATRLNPTDQAAKFEPWPKKHLGEADLAHGRRQLQEMLTDCPAMARYAEGADALYQWADRKFAGENLGERVYWDDVPPSPFTTAESYCPPTEPARIRVRDVPRRG